MSETPNLIDTHCHLDVEEFDADRDRILADARAAGVVELVIPAVRRGTWQGLLEFCATDPGLHPALGLHPVYLTRHQRADLDELEHQLARNNPVAIGEIGLDFHLKDLDQTHQMQLLEAQLAIADNARLPVLLHCRKAHEPMLRLLKQAKPAGGICHAFNGSLEQAKRYLDLGFKLGFGGMLTFERSTRLRQLARELPLEAMVLETDAPDMPPASHQYRRNSPSYLPEVLASLAELRDLPAADIAAVTSANARAALPRLDKNKKPDQ